MNRSQLLKLRIENIQSKLTKTNLLAVTKYSQIDDIEMAYCHGLRDFGENRLQDLQSKSKQLHHLADIRWHFIGHIQSKKLKDILKIPGLCAIHSISSLKLVKLLVKEGANLDTDIYLQVNTSGESEKDGFENYQQLKNAYTLLKQAKRDHLFKGLMTMGKIRTDNFKKDARSCFMKCHEFGDQLKQDFALESVKYSMGMSADYPIAMEVGTDWVRIGSQIFAIE